MIINNFSISPRQLEKLQEYTYQTEAPILPPCGEVGSQSYTDSNGKSNFFSQPNPIINVKIVKRTNTLGVNSTTDSNGYYKCVIIDQFNSDSGNLVSEFRIDSSGVVLNEGDLAQGLLYGISETYPLLKMVSGVNGADISLIYVGTLASNKTYIGTIASNNSTLSLNVTNTCWVRPPLYNATQTLNVGNLYYGKRTGTTIVGSRTLPLYTTDFSGTGSVNLNSTLIVNTINSDLSTTTTTQTGTTNTLTANSQAGLYFGTNSDTGYLTLNQCPASITANGYMSNTTQTISGQKYYLGADYQIFGYTTSLSNNPPTRTGGSWNNAQGTWFFDDRFGSIVFTNGAKTFQIYIDQDLSTHRFVMNYGNRNSSGGTPVGLSGTDYVGFECYLSAGDPVLDAYCFAANGTKGFTGTGAYTNFTIQGGIIISAS